VTSDGPWGRHDDLDVGLSVEVPPGWDVAEGGGYALVLVAPELDGFRANVGFDVGPLEPPTPEGFRAAVEGSVEQRRAELDAFDLVAQRPLEQDGRPGVVQRSRWRLDTGHELAQVTALFTDGTQLWQVHGTCLASREQEDEATFRRVLASILWAVPAS
jgi:hypothetical protein